MIELMEGIRRYPKSQRYTLGERTEKALLTSIENIYMASYMKKQRLDHLLQARTQIQLILFLLRLAKRLKFMSDGFHEKISLDLIEVGKMLSGWIKTCEKDFYVKTV